MMARWVKSIRLDIPRFSLFFNINLSMLYIISLLRFQFGQNRLPAHAFYLNLYLSPFFPYHYEIELCYFLINRISTLSLFFFSQTKEAVNLIHFFFRS